MVAPELLVQYALERYYNVSRKPRVVQVQDRRRRTSCRSRTPGRARCRSARRCRRRRRSDAPSDAPVYSGFGSGPLKIDVDSMAGYLDDTPEAAAAEVGPHPDGQGLGDARRRADRRRHLRRGHALRRAGRGAAGRVPLAQRAPRRLARAGHRQRACCGSSTSASRRRRRSRACSPAARRGSGRLYAAELGALAKPLGAAREGLGVILPVRIGKRAVGAVVGLDASLERLAPQEGSRSPGGQARPGAAHQLPATPLDAAVAGCDGAHKQRQRPVQVAVLLQTQQVCRPLQHLAAAGAVVVVGRGAGAGAAVGLALAAHLAAGVAVRRIARQILAAFAGAAGLLVAAGAAALAAALTADAGVAVHARRIARRRHALALDAGVAGRAARVAVAAVVGVARRVEAAAAARGRARRAADLLPVHVAAPLHEQMPRRCRTRPSCRRGRRRRSWCVLSPRHMPPQHSCVAVQAVVPHKHCPPEQTSPVRHCLPQAPQLLRIVGGVGAARRAAGVAGGADGAAAGAGAVAARQRRGAGVPAGAAVGVVALGVDAAAVLSQQTLGKVHAAPLHGQAPVVEQVPVSAQQSVVAACRRCRRAALAGAGDAGLARVAGVIAGAAVEGSVCRSMQPVAVQQVVPPRRPSRRRSGRRRPSSCRRSGRRRCRSRRSWPRPTARWCRWCCRSRPGWRRTAACRRSVCR